MEDLKKTWQKPVLIVIGRGTIEENVLAGCKHVGMAGPGGADCKDAKGNCQAHGNT